MVYSDTPGERVRTEDTPAELRGKFSLSDEDVHELSKQALVIEKHYQRPMDIEWAKDGVSGKLFIVQARPETVKSRAKATQIERFQLEKRGDVVVRSEEHTSELQSLMRTSYAVFRLKKKHTRHTTSIT